MYTYWLNFSRLSLRFIHICNYLCIALLIVDNTSIQYIIALLPQ
uniref:Uncharacterized protein n=1 Tax=Arundo donax TaxID=35708 RepID=A0A0A9FJ18_ARUDO